MLYTKPPKLAIISFDQQARTGRENKEPGKGSSRQLLCKTKSFDISVSLTVFEVNQHSALTCIKARDTGRDFPARNSYLTIPDGQPSSRGLSRIRSAYISEGWYVIIWL